MILSRRRRRKLLLENSLVSLAQANVITIEREQISNGAQGVSKGGKIILDESAGTKVLIREIAHELLHKQDRSQSCQEREIEADAIAYVVADHFGLEVQTSANYLVLWEAESSEILSSLERIRQTVTEIMLYLEKEQITQ